MIKPLAEAGIAALVPHRVADVGEQLCHHVPTLAASAVSQVRRQLIMVLAMLCPHKVVGALPAEALGIPLLIQIWQMDAQQCDLGRTTDNDKCHHHDHVRNAQEQYHSAGQLILQGTFVCAMLVSNAAMHTPLHVVVSTHLTVGLMSVH
jgi:hypothetical protein